MIDLTTRIPYYPGKRLGGAYLNEITTVKDWVLFLDHDVFLSLNPYWNDICRSAIERVGHKAGWITCKTNRIGCPLQKAKDIPKGMDDMAWHFKYAEELYKRNKGLITECTDIEGWKFSGFFILTSKEAFTKVKVLSTGSKALPENKFIGFDNWYYDRLIECGFKTYIMEDLYVYHGYKRLWKDGSWGRLWPRE